MDKLTLKIFEFAFYVNHQKYLGLLLMSKNEIPKIIDVDKIFMDKNPSMYKLLPGFVLKYIHT